MKPVFEENPDIEGLFHTLVVSKEKLNILKRWQYLYILVVFSQVEFPPNKWGLSMNGGQQALMEERMP